MTPPRLIEHAFPLKQASLTSVHEKNVRHGHKELAPFYPTYADLEPVQKGGASVSLADSEMATETVAPPSSWADNSLYFNPYEPTDIRERRFPHWTQPDTAFFVTFRLTDSIPGPKLKQWQREREAWLAAHPESDVTPELRKEYYRLFNDRMEAWLDAGECECLLRNPQARRKTWKSGLRTPILGLSLFS